jgi:Flp pilus assembly protein TadD
MVAHDPMKLQGTAPQADPSLLREAQAAMDSGDLQRAEALFVEHFMRARDDAMGLAQFGIFCTLTGRHAIASYLLYKANALQPGDSDTLNRLGYAQLAQRDFNAARCSFEAVLAHEQAHPQANYGLALCLQHAGAWPAAVDAFAKAHAAQPDAAPILLNDRSLRPAAAR